MPYASVENIFKNSTSGNSGSLQVTTSGVTEGNRLLFVVAHDGGEASRSITDIEREDGPAVSIFGSVTEFDQAESSSHTMRAFDYVAAAGDAGGNVYTFSCSNSEQMAIFIVELSGENGRDTFLMTSTLANAAPVLAEITTSEVEVLVLSFLSVETTGATTTYPTGWTSDQDTVITSGGGGARLSMASREFASAGGTGSVTWGISQAQNSVGLLVGIKTSSPTPTNTPATIELNTVDNYTLENNDSRYTLEVNTVNQYTLENS